MRWRYCTGTDTRYLLTTSRLGPLFEALAGEYLVLEIEGTRLHHYQTLYFDPSDFALFCRHHAGAAVRHKVSGRAYLDTGLSFLEVKAKDNRGRTRVHRRLPGVVVRSGSSTGSTAPRPSCTRCAPRVRPAGMSKYCFEASHRLT